MANKKVLTDHMEKRLGKKKHLGVFRSNKELIALFGNEGVGARHQAGLTRKMIEKGIKSGELTSIDEIDQIIENSSKEYQEYREKLNPRNKKRVQDVREKEANDPKEEKKRIDEEPKFNVIYRPPVGTKKTVTYRPTDWKGLKRTNNTIAGGILFGPVGAAAGYALSDKPKEPKIKTKVVSDYGYKKKNCHVEIEEDKLKFSYTMGLIKNKTHQFIRFNEIHSTDLRNSIILDIELNDNSKFTFIQQGSSLHGIPPQYRGYTKDLFKELESKVKDYQSKNKSEILESHPKNRSTEKDPIDQIKKLNELKEVGIITNEEFEDKKRELLNRI